MKRLPLLLIAISCFFCFSTNAQTSLLKDTVIGNPNPCAGVPTSYSLLGKNIGPGISYRWYQSSASSSGPWTLIGSSISPTITINNQPPGPTWLTCVTISVVPALSDTAVEIMIIPNAFSPASLCYCSTSKATIDSFSEIGQFSIGSLTNPAVAPPLINNSGTPQGYSNFDTISPIPTFYKGQSYPISVLPKFFQSTANNGWTKVWIDYNHNTAWDPSENIFSSPIVAPNYNTSGTFTIPSTALAGPTRLRVVYNMQGTATGTQACGTYNYGETEDYLVNILAAGPHDPAVSNIQVLPSSSCLDNSNTVAVTIQNLGSQTLNLNTYPLVVRLRVQGPNGLNFYTDTLSSGLLQGFGANAVTTIFNPVNMHGGGTYTINTDTLYLIGSSNTNYVNDSLFKAVEITNSRPKNVDYQLCQGGNIPAGQGLSIQDCPTTVLRDSVLIPFNLHFSGNTVPSPSQCSAIGASNFASASLPNLYGLTSILRGELLVTNLTLDTPTILHSNSDVRFSLYTGNTGNSFHLGQIGNPGLQPTTSFSYINFPTSADINSIYTNGVSNYSTINMGYWSVGSNSCNVPGIRVNSGNPTTATLKIVYEYIPQGVTWYEQPSGGISISDSSVLNPLTTPNNIITNSNTLGTYTFYGACAFDTNCRIPVDLTIGQLNFTNVTTTNVQCNGGTSGIIMVTASGVSAPITYSLLPISATNLSGQFSNLIAGIYTVRATSVNGCTRDTVVTILEPALFSIDTLSTTNVLCKGDSTGIATVSFSGGSGTSTATISPAIGFQAPAGTFAGLPAGTYTAIGTDANGCSASTLFTIVEPATGVQITNVTTTTPSCVPGCDATMTITATAGGTGFLQYSIGGAPQASNTFTNSCSGNYTVSVTDGNGCTAFSTATIATPGAPTFTSLSSTPANCSDSTGTISVTIAPGASPNISVSISPNLGILSGSGFTNLPTGNYTISATDGNGCSISTNVFVGSINSIQIDAISVTDANCNLNNGSIYIRAANPANISYSINTIPPQSNTTGLFSNLGIGNYTITLSDVTNCHTSTSIAVNKGVRFTVDSITTIPDKCFAGVVGFAKIHVQSSSNLLFNIDNQVTNYTGEFPSVNPGNHMAIIIDTACNDTLRIPFIMPVSDSVSLVTNVTQPSCFGFCDGQIICSTNTTKPHYYTIDSLTSNTGIFDSLCNSFGVLRVNLHYDSICTLSKNVTIQEPANISISANNISQPSCIPLKLTGGFKYNTVAGLSPFTIEANGQSKVYNSANPQDSLTNLNPGIYPIIITDASGCKDSIKVEIRLSQPSIDSITIFPKQCKYSLLGGIFPHVSNTTSINTYTPAYTNLNTNITTNQNSNLDSGFYHIMVTDNFSQCVATDTFYIPFKPTNFPLDVYDITDASCTGVQDGRIEYLLTRLPPFTYSTSPNIGVQSTSRIITALAEGAYIVTGEDSLGCAGMDTVNVGILDNRSFFYTTTKSSNVHCYGSVRLAAEGGVGDYKYSISPNQGQQITNGYFDGLCWGDYSILATDSAGCSISQTIQILQDPNAPTNMFDHITIYPNPGDDLIYFKSDYLFDYEVSLINITGKCLLKKDIYNKLGSLSTASLAPGIYILRFKSQIDNADKKIVIQH